MSDELSILIKTLIHIYMRTIEELRILPTKDYKEEDKQLLRDKGVINWVWGANLHKILRWIMTQLFYYLDFEVHDINYWKLTFMLDKELREIERKKADFWILKYSWIWPIRVIEKFELSWIVLKDILNVIYTVIVFSINLIPMLLSPLAYIAVRLWWDKAIKKELINNKKLWLI